MIYKFDGILFFEAKDKDDAFLQLSKHFSALAGQGDGIALLKESEAYIEPQEHVDVVQQFSATRREIP